MQGDLAELVPIQVGLPGSQSAHQVDGKHVGVEAPQESPDLVHERPADRVFRGNLLDDPAPGFLASLQSFG